VRARREAARRPEGWRAATGLWTIGLVLAGAARAELPAGWAVHVFAGRIHEIETAGGVLACATDGGLLLYDPATDAWAPIADAGCPDRDCLTSNRLTSVSRDAAGRYWLGTAASGVVAYRPHEGPDEYARFFERNGAPGANLLADSVTCVEAWSDQVVYVGTTVGVAQIDLAGDVLSYNPDADRRTDAGGDVRGNTVRDLAVDADHVWVATDAGPSRYGRRPPYAVEFLPDSLPSPGCWSVEVLGGAVYVGTDTGVFAWNQAAHAWRRLEDTVNPASTPAFRALGLARLPDGRIAASSEPHLWLHDGSRWVQNTPPFTVTIGSRRLPTVAVRGDTLWTSQGNSLGMGAFLERWTAAGGWTRHRPSAPPVSEMRVVSLDAQGNAWVGTRFGGVARLDPAGSWCLFDADDPSVRANMFDAAGHVFGLAADRAGTVWFTPLGFSGETSPVDVLRADPACVHANDVWQRIDAGELGFGGRYWRILEDGAGNRFFLSDADGAGGGIDVLSPDGTASLNLRGDLLGGSKVLALGFDQRDTAWKFAYFGIDDQGNAGLRQWYQDEPLFGGGGPGPINFTTLPLGTLSVTAYRDIVVTGPPADPVLWVATDAGIFEYEVDRGVRLQLGAKTGAAAGLLGVDVKDLQLDDFGNLWIATIKGLNRIRLGERVPGGPVTVDAYTTIETIRELNDASTAGQIYDSTRNLAPLPSPAVNSLAYDAARDVLFLATTGGLVSLDVQGIDRRAQRALTEAILYPNPVRLDAGHREVRLGRVSEAARVTIYNLEGEKVCEIEPVEEGDVVWDLDLPSCIDGDVQAASGIYLVRIETSAGSTLRNLVVVR
jgi:ligand-binding sensor domain-containing protein